MNKNFKNHISSPSSIKKLPTKAMKNYKPVFCGLTNGGGGGHLKKLSQI